MPVLGVTMGDPSGIGPEIVLRALQEYKNTRAEFRLIGVDHAVHPGCPGPETSRMALEALEEAAHLANKGEIDGVVTGPVSKQHLHQVGFPYPGQTEFFAARSGTDNFAMLLTGGAITVALVTAHLPLREVAGTLCVDEIVRVGTLLHRFCIRRGYAKPRLAVAGLNPHAGEGGDLGREEITTISPAVQELDRLFPGCFSGPHSPDTVFFHARENRFDGVLCMYHDQGLIPLKMHAFDQGVNVTLGLPFVRTSPDHGTAFALAGKGGARASSMLAALDLASALCLSQESALSSSGIGKNSL